MDIRIFPRLPFWRHHFAPNIRRSVAYALSFVYVRFCSEPFFLLLRLLHLIFFVNVVQNKQPFGLHSKALCLEYGRKNVGSKRGNVLEKKIEQVNNISDATRKVRDGMVRMWKYLDHLSVSNPSASIASFEMKVCVCVCVIFSHCFLSLVACTGANRWPNFLSNSTVPKEKPPSVSRCKWSCACNFPFRTQKGCFFYFPSGGWVAFFTTEEEKRPLEACTVGTARKRRIGLSSWNCSIYVQSSFELGICAWKPSLL